MKNKQNKIKDNNKTNSDSNQLSWYEKNIIKSNLLKYIAENPIKAEKSNISLSPYYQISFFKNNTFKFAIMAVLFVAIMPIGGLYFASAKSLPSSSFLWNSKIIFDNIKYELAPTAEMKADIALEMTEKRLNEIALAKKQNLLTPRNIKVLSSELERQANNIEIQSRSITSKDPVLALSVTNKLKQSISVSEIVLGEKDIDLESSLTSIKNSASELSESIYSENLSGSDDQINIAKNRASELQNYLALVSPIILEEIPIVKVSSEDPLVLNSSNSLITAKISENDEPANLYSLEINTEFDSLSDDTKEQTVTKSVVPIEDSVTDIKKPIDTSLDVYKSANKNLETALDLIKTGDAKQAILLIDKSIIDIKSILKTAEINE